MLAEIIFVYCVHYVIYFMYFWNLCLFVTNFNVIIIVIVTTKMNIVKIDANSSPSHNKILTESHL